MALQEALNYIGLLFAFLFLVARFNSKHIADYLYGISFVLFFILELRPQADPFHEAEFIVVAVCMLIATGLKIRSSYLRKIHRA